MWKERRRKYHALNEQLRNSIRNKAHCIQSQDPTTNHEEAEMEATYAIMHSTDRSTKNLIESWQTAKSSITEQTGIADIAKAEVLFSTACDTLEWLEWKKLREDAEDELEHNNQAITKRLKELVPALSAATLNFVKHRPRNRWMQHMKAEVDLANAQIAVWNRLFPFLPMDARLFVLNELSLLTKKLEGPSDQIFTTFLQAKSKS